MKFRIGVLGATGYIGTPYRDEIRGAGEDADIVALCARRRDRLEAAKLEDGAALVTTDWREVVNHPDINLVLVLTPDALHHEAVMECAAQGKHLFCEKPIGVDAKQAAEMWTAVREARIGHYVPFWTRYVPVFARAREIVASGALGETKVVVYRWHNPRPRAMPFTWRDDADLSSAGSIADVGSHAYDAIRWVLGDEASRVVCHAGTISDAKPDLGPIDLLEAIAWGESHSVGDSQKHRKGTAFDYASIAWEFNSGAVGTLVLSHAPFLRKGLSPELEIHGTDASLAIDRINSEVCVTRDGGEAASTETIEDTGFGNRFAKHVFPGLRERIDGGESEHPGMDDGWRVQQFTDAAARSARERAWVEIDG